MSPTGTMVRTKDKASLNFYLSRQGQVDFHNLDKLTLFLSSMSLCPYINGTPVDIFK